MSVTHQASPPAGFIERLQQVGMHPGWAKREPAMWPEPRHTYVPAVWRAAEARAALKEASEFVSPEFAERRNLILANPIAGNTYPSCATMVAAYQLVLPGENARSHRHTPNALRFVIDAEKGMTTLVNGMRVAMAPGDVVLTPQWHWHGHENTSPAPAFWIDVLDVPLVQKLENIFFQHHPDVLETVKGDDLDSKLRLTASATAEAGRASGSTIIGRNILSTIELRMARIEPQERTKAQASINNVLLIVADGNLWLEVAPLGRVALKRGDVAVVPSWTAHAVEGSEDGAMLLTISDAPVFANLGFVDPRSFAQEET